MSAIGLRRTAPTGQLTIRASIFLGFALMCVFTAALEYSAAKMIAQSATAVSDTFDRSLASIDYARAVATDFSAMQSGFLRLRLAMGSARQKEREAELGLLARTFYADLDISETRSQSVQARRAAETVRNAADQWQRNGNDLDPQLPLQEVLAGLDADAGAVFRQIDQLVSLTASDGVLYRQQALQSVQGETERDFGLMVAALLLSAAVTWMMARRISGPVSAASTIAARIASGDLDVVVPVGRRDELGDLLRSMATMRDSVRAMMQEEVAQRRSAQARLMDAIESSQEGVLLVDPSGRIVVANAHLAGFFGDLHEHFAPGASLSKLVNVLARTKLVDESRQTIDALPWSSGGEAPGTVEVGLLNGRWLRISWCSTREGGLIAFFSDITLSRIRVAQLKQTNLWLDAALTNMSQGLCLYDGDARLKVANARFREIYSLAVEEIPPGTTLDTVLSILDAVILDTATGASVGVAEREAIRGQIATRTPFARQHELLDGRVIAFSHRPIADGGWVLIYEDVTERHHTEAGISHIARHDKLTDLPNRALFGERLAEAVAALDHGSSFSLLIVDLDRFKAVNDTYGHPIGDALLRAVGRRLLACSHDGDTVARDTVARLGGDEFAIVAAGLGSAQDAEQFAGRIIRTLAEPFAIEGYRLEIGASVGIAIATQTGCEADGLLRDADMALCSAKKAGRSSYALFTPDMAMELQARRFLEHDLLQSLADGQMELRLSASSWKSPKPRC
jgi:diguanylate cyclase (GGDEF)-like protein